MNCKECNKEIDEESSFCKYCDKKIEIEDTIQQLKEMVNDVKEIFIIDNLFYKENPECLKKFRKFAKEKLKFLEKLKKQGKYEDFIEKCEKRLYKEDDKQNYRRN